MYLTDEVCEKPKKYCFQFNAIARDRKYWKIIRVKDERIKLFESLINLKIIEFRFI